MLLDSPHCIAVRPAEERACISRIRRAVSNASKIDRARERAARLYAEAENCLTFAVSEEDEAHAAELIDEALRLARRSRELAEG